MYSLRVVIIIFIVAISFDHSTPLSLTNSTSSISFKDSTYENLHKSILGMLDTHYNKLKDCQSVSECNTLLDNFVQLEGLLNTMTNQKLFKNPFIRG